MRWIEIAPGFACNCRCPGCFSCDADPAMQMDWPALLRWLQFGRARGAEGLWLGGGEPTLRRDFLKTIRVAARLGYTRLKVQSNGLLLSYPQMVEKAVAAGMNEVGLLLKSLDPALHDELNGLQGAHALLDKAIELLAPQPLRLEGDVLMTSRNFRELPELVASYADRGLVHFNIWLFSLADAQERGLRELVPELVEAMPYVARARDVALSRGATLCSLHTPHCLVPAEHWPMHFDVVGTAMFVANPGDRGFMLQDSPMEEAAWVEACEGCALRGPCRGVRSEIARLHGTQGIRAVTAEQAAGRYVRGMIL